MLAVFSGCATIVQETAGRVIQDRSGADQKTDAEIHAGILDRLTDKDKGLLLDISTDVWKQRVMITGTLDDAKVHQEVVQLAKQDKRIKEFIDHVQMVPKEVKEARREQKKDSESGKEEEKGGPGQAVNDFWIETKIKAKLVTTSGIASLNYFYRSVMNNIYIIGEADSQREKDLVLKTIRQAKGVKTITEHIKLVK